MKDKEEKRYSKGFLLLGIILFLIIIISFVFGDAGVVELIKTKNKIENLKRDIEILKQEREQLKKEINFIKSNPLALETKAREKLWLMKKNEKVVIIIKSK